MEGLTRLVSESLARHGFDRPLDYRHLRWSRWFRCESHHSLLFVPSKAGVFALAEEIADFSTHGAADAASPEPGQRVRAQSEASALAGTPEAVSSPRRMLAVTQFFEDDDMAFVLDRMLSRENPMRVRLLSGRYFVRFVVIEDPIQRHGICNALNQWILSSSEKTTGIGADFATSLELPETSNLNGDRMSRTLSSVTANSSATPGNQPESDAKPQSAASHLQSGVATNIHCPSPLPSGF
jgi:hypothetical protein